MYSIKHVIKREYVNEIFRVFNLFFKTNKPKMVKAETTVTNGLSSTKNLKIAKVAA